MALGKNRVIFQDLGHMRYADAWAYQGELHKELTDRKKDALDNKHAHRLLFVEHPPVYTLGKSGSMDNLLLTDRALETKGIDFFRINRGGDITYHGPGQVVAYPIFDLDCFKRDIRWFIHTLEEAVIQTLQVYGIDAKRMPDFTGVWIKKKEDEQERKICAIGVHLSRWVTMHGIAFNINTDLEYFHQIIPCGIADKDKTVSSLASELKKQTDIDEVKKILKDKFAALFEYEYV